MALRKEKGCDNALAKMEDEEGEPLFDQNPVRVTCPRCRVSIITFIEYEASWVTYGMAIFLFTVLNWAALCIVPVVYPLFKDVVHHCPRCLAVLATRSRVVLPNPKQEVMSFRFGSCVVVLARKYVLLLLALVTLISGVHFMRNSAAQGAAVDSWHRGPPVNVTWQDFVQDCGTKTYIGNPIHVKMAFEDKYKNNTVHWEGKMERLDDSFHFWFLDRKGAVFTRMEPAQYDAGQSDLLLIYNHSDAVAEKARELTQGAPFSFDATLVQVGRRGLPHVLVLWEVGPPTGSAPVAPRIDRVPSEHTPPIESKLPPEPEQQSGPSSGGAS